MQLYWGDLHNHCGISYGYGALENALTAARGQLDFCSVTGHAQWHDMPAGAKGFEFIEDFHRRGFAKLAGDWDKVRTTMAEANAPGRFVTLQSYEAHSRTYGDHHILSPSDDLPLIEADSPPALIEAIAPLPAIAVPHHVAYVPGYRGINWSAFDPGISPIVEVFSKHGASMSDTGPYPYLHSMGPRDSRNTVRTGLRLGNRFGFAASTDHHAGYPGSYGDGRVAVLAEELTRAAIWEALLARRTYAVTGDKIRCEFAVNGACMGSEVAAAARQDVALTATGCDAIDKVIVYRNGQPWQVVCGECLAGGARAERYKVRIESGWGHATESYGWEGVARVRGGELTGVEPCFRGRNVLAPSRDKTEDAAINALDNRIVEQAEDHVVWRAVTVKNPSTLHPATASVILEIRGDASTVLDVELNGTKLTVSLGDLAAGSRGVHTKLYNSEAFLIHRAVPETAYAFAREWSDVPTGGACDVYDVEVRQVNGQCAWVTPVFVVG